MRQAGAYSFNVPTPQRDSVRPGIRLGPPAGSNQALLDDVLARPDDEAARLRLADWLDEHCLPQGEFIRVQCRLANLPANHRLVFELERREQELLADHEMEWAEEVAGLVEWWTFRRGFVEEIGLSAAQFLAHADRIFRLAPIQVLHIDGVRGILQSVAYSGHLQRVRYLDLSNNNLRDDGARMLANSPYLTCLRGLNLSSARIGDAGLKALLASPYLGELRELYLCDNRITAAGAHALAQSELAQRLDILHVRFNEIEVEAAVVLQRRLGARVYI